MSASTRSISRSVPRLAAAGPADCLLAAVLFIAFELPVLASVVIGGAARAQAASWALAAVIGGAMTLTLAWRRKHPRQIWMITTGCGLFVLSAPTQIGLAHASSPAEVALLALPAPLVALYTVASTGRIRSGYALAGSALGLLVLPLVLLNVQWLLSSHSGDFRRANGAPYAALAAGAVAAAWAVAERVRARTKIEAARRAEHDRAVVAEERARIAAELHDITAHHISVVSLQAGAARLLAEQGQAPSAELLAGIEAASRQAMEEIRQALGVIRAGPHGPAPLPGLAQLPDLAARMTLGGLTVTIDGPAGPLPGSADLTAYRIVQEGLANVARHSASGHAAVTFRREPGALHITISDDGPPLQGPPLVPGGNGLTGLRERLRSHGGRLHAGSRPSGGFELVAELPLAGSA